VFDLLQFGLDVQQAMTTRIFRVMAGELSPREARRMITESSLSIRTRTSLVPARF
jgi:hypothetical protein